MIARGVYITFRYFRRELGLSPAAALRATRADALAEALRSRWVWCRPDASTPEHGALWAELQAADRAYAIALGYRPPVVPHIATVHDVLPSGELALSKVVALNITRTI